MSKNHLKTIPLVLAWLFRPNLGRFFNDLILLIGIALPLSGYSICIDASSANLRVGPSKKSDRSWRVPKYMPLKTIEQRGGWLKVVDVDGEKHWAHKSVLTRRHRCVVVKTPFTFLRKGPGQRYGMAPIEVFDKYSAFKRLDKKGGWVQVEVTPRMTAWISEKNLWEPLKKQTINF